MNKRSLLATAVASLLTLGAMQARAADDLSVAVGGRAIIAYLRSLPKQ